MSRAVGRASEGAQPHLAELDSAAGQINTWSVNLTVRPFAGVVGGYKTVVAGAAGTVLLTADYTVARLDLGIASRTGSLDRLSGVADFMTHPLESTKAHVGGMLNDIADREARGDIWGASFVSGELGGEVALLAEGVAGLARFGIATAGKFRLNLAQRSSGG